MSQADCVQTNKKLMKCFVFGASLTTIKDLKNRVDSDPFTVHSYHYSYSIRSNHMFQLSKKPWSVLSHHAKPNQPFLSSPR